MIDPDKLLCIWVFKIWFARCGSLIFRQYT